MGKIPEPVLPETDDMMLQMERNRELVPCQIETLCRRRCRTLRVDTKTMGTLEANRPSPKRALIARVRSEQNHARVFFGKGHAPNSNTRSRRNNPSTSKGRVRRSRSTATIVGVPQCERRSNQWDGPLATWSSRPSDSAELRCIPPEVRELVGTTRRKIVTDAEIDAATSTRMENEFMKGYPTSSKERLLSAWMGKYPSFGRHGARKLPEGWQRLQGWQRLSPRRSRKPWVRAVWSGTACRLVGQSQHSLGLLVMTGLLSYARPGELLLRMRRCDLVPPLRRALQKFSGPLARKLVPFWMARRGQSSKNPFFQKATTDSTLPPFVPHRWTQQTAPGSWSKSKNEDDGKS